jgi:hypothetical protein
VQIVISRLETERTEGFGIYVSGGQNRDGGIVLKF